MSESKRETRDARRETKKGRVIVLSAPSGTGKSTVVARLRMKIPKLQFSISCTTRKPRGTEKNGVEYHFIDRAEFDRMIAAREFAEWAKVHGERYGTPRKPLDEVVASGCDILLDIDVQGGMSVKKLIPDALLIFLAPPSMEELERRLTERGTDSAEQIRLRLENARKEMQYEKRYDRVVINDDIGRCVEELERILSCETA